MRGSPYVKPFEAEIRSWEEKLLSMQDILDAWIKKLRILSEYNHTLKNVLKASVVFTSHLSKKLKA
ncbi:Dynein heavy chain 3, axonemal [Portunus trituberculatus]|uniref:Dynein heavy chain 3, axonemal n=1 Tax=Portunus trituberculatus TaxID=210409 RepID=A0A5B7G8R3_PORTR|nr:Dynein heavy chain 3, axonemal [Portunus trituberculatus]